MKNLLVSLMAMLIATSALAIVDQDPDQMGFYFNLNAHDPCIFDIAPFDNVPMYLLFTRPTVDAICGFECGFDLVGNGLILGYEFANPQVIDVGVYNNIIVGFGEPTITTPATLLATFDVMYMDEENLPLEFYLRGSEPSSIDPLYPVVLLQGGELMSVGISAAVGPTAQINGLDCGVVATVPVSFDQIKSMYR